MKHLQSQLRSSPCGLGSPLNLTLKLVGSLGMDSALMTRQCCEICSNYYGGGGLSIVYSVGNNTDSYGAVICDVALLFFNLTISPSAVLVPVLYVPQAVGDVLCLRVSGGGATNQPKV